MTSTNSLSFFSLVPNNVEVFISKYEPLEVVKCEKCEKVIAETKELIRIQKNTRETS